MVKESGLTALQLAQFNGKGYQDIEVMKLNQKWLDEVRERCEKASRGPWEYRPTKYQILECEECQEEMTNLGYSIRSTHEKDECRLFCELYGFEDFANTDGPFIAHAREDLPLAISIIEHQAKMLERCEDLIRSRVIEIGYEARELLAELEKAEM